MEDGDVQQAPAAVAGSLPESSAASDPVRESIADTSISASRTDDEARAAAPDAVAPSAVSPTNTPLPLDTAFDVSAMAEAMELNLRTHAPPSAKTSDPVQQHAAPTTANATPATVPSEELDAIANGFRKLNAEMRGFPAELD